MQAAQHHTAQQPGVLADHAGSGGFVQRALPQRFVAVALQLEKQLPLMHVVAFFI